MAKNDDKRIRESNDPLVTGAIGTGALLAALGAAVGGWIGYSRLRVDHQKPLPQAIDAQRRTFTGPAGMLSYYVDTSVSGRPLVLIHSINAAGCAYEVRPLFEHYRHVRPVYALDLPGFGFSERSNRVYSVRMYSDAILDMLRTQVSGGQAADVIALSLSSEFLARAAKEQPELFHSLTLISPSGFTDRRKKRASQAASQNGGSDPAHRWLSFRPWSQAAYDLLVTRASLNYFLKKSFEGPVDPGLLEYSYFTTHRPGARFAPLYFVSGKLFSPDILEAVYEQITVPTLVVYDRDNFVRFDRLAEVVEHHANWRVVRIVPTLGLPQFEKPNETAQALDHFWQELP